MDITDNKSFRSISPQDWAQLDPGTKRSLMGAKHGGILRSSEPAIQQGLAMALAGNPEHGIPPMLMEDLVAVCMDIDEEITPKELQDAAARAVPPQEVSVFISRREDLAAGIMNFKMQMPGKGRGKKSKKTVMKAPYAEAAQALRTPPPANHLYMAVFADGMCTIGCYALATPEVAPLPAEVPAPPQEPQGVSIGTP